MAGAQTKAGKSATSCMVIVQAAGAAEYPSSATVAPGRPRSWAASASRRPHAPCRRRPTAILGQRPAGDSPAAPGWGADRSRLCAHPDAAIDAPGRLPVVRAFLARRMRDKRSAAGGAMDSISAFLSVLARAIDEVDVICREKRSDYWDTLSAVLKDRHFIEMVVDEMSDPQISWQSAIALMLRKS